MGEVQTHRPIYLIAAVSSRYDQAFDWSVEEMVKIWGDVALSSARFDFVETKFYERTMGTDLKKQFFAFQSLVPPDSIADAKLNSNALEKRFASSFDCEEERPLNIDPGYISEAKLVLATTKDRDHRLYMQKGIFAEVTLHYHQKLWRASRWTYPDYQREDFQAFFTQVRNSLRQRYRNGEV